MNEYIMCYTPSGMLFTVNAEESATQLATTFENNIYFYVDLETNYS